MGFVITHLPPGNYQILAYGGNSSGGVFKFFVSLTRENVVYPPPIVLGEPMYRAQVIDSAGKGIQNAKVTLTNESSRETHTAISDEGGFYHLPFLSPGSYTIVISKAGHSELSATRFPISMAREEAAPPDNPAQCNVTGKVIDPAGQGLVDAQVTVINETNRAITQIRTDEAGNYCVPKLLTGLYTVAVSKPGYASSTIFGFELLSNLDKAVVPLITLMPDSSSQLSAGREAALVLTRADIARSTNFTGQQMETLPLGSMTYMRSFDELALLAPGVTPAPYTPGVRSPGIGFGIGTAGQFSVNGMRARSNNFAIDGSDNNDPDVGVRRQGFLALVPQSIESVNELLISTLLWDAELGRNLGSQVNVVSKYGEDVITDRHMPSSTILD